MLSCVSVTLNLAYLPSRSRRQLPSRSLLRSPPSVLPRKLGPWGHSAAWHDPHTPAAIALGRSMGGGGVSGRGAHLSVITAITISGCSLLFLALVRRSRLAHKGEGDASSSSGVKRRKKKNMAVRFSEDVAEPRSNGAEYRTRLQPPRRGRPAPAVGGGHRASRGGRPADDPQDRKTKAVDCGGRDGAGREDTSIPGNWSALYRGLCQYRSQMATVMLYHA